MSNYSGKKRILLVDDEHDNSSIFKIGLEDAGFEVNAYSDPKLALSAFKPYYYDLLILDIRMPKMDGYELYDKIRNKDDKVKVCFLTASERYKEEHIPSFLSSGSTDCFLIKPIKIDDLVKKVNEMIKQK
ncbi:MAG TPA: response regulator [Nitrososphaeraceae archaeon]|nr:response regulator [Nitrososphaeraceae archaeon]